MCPLAPHPALRCLSLKVRSAVFVEGVELASPVEQVLVGGPACQPPADSRAILLEYSQGSMCFVVVTALPSVHAEFPTTGKFNRAHDREPKLRTESPATKPKNKDLYILLDITHVF